MSALSGGSWGGAWAPFPSPDNHCKPSPTGQAALAPKSSGSHGTMFVGSGFSGCPGHAFLCQKNTVNSGRQLGAWPSYMCLFQVLDISESKSQTFLIHGLTFQQERNVKSRIYKEIL